MDQAPHRASNCTILYIGTISTRASHSTSPTPFIPHHTPQDTLNVLRPLERDSLQAQKNRSNSPIGPLLVQNAVSTVPATDRLATLQRHR